MDLGYNFNSIDFKDYHYCINDCRCFHNYIFQIEESELIKELKTKNSLELKELSVAKHFLIGLYDYQVEVVAYDLKVERM